MTRGDQLTFSQDIRATDIRPNDIVSTKIWRQPSTKGKECEGSQRKRISLGLNVGSNEVARSQSYKTFFIVTEHKLGRLFLEFWG